MRSHRRRIVGAIVASLIAWAASSVVAGPAYAWRAPGLGFRASSQTWISPEHGWMLGSVPCGLGTCTTVVHSTDGGQTWSRLGTLNAPLGFDQATGVTEVRFADDLDGWAFEPALWHSTDGGTTWTKQRPPDGGVVLALAGDAQGVYMVVSPCPFGQSCPLPVTLWRTTPGGAWTKVPLRLRGFSGFTEVVLAVYGPVAYLVIPTIDSMDPDLLEVTLDGQTWSARPSPCDKSQGEYLSSLAPVSQTKVALLCQSDIGFGKAEKRVFRSGNNAQSTSFAGRLPDLGIVSQLAAASNGTLLVSSYSIGSWIYRNAGDLVWTTPVNLGDGGMGWNDIAFTTSQIGFVIHGPAFCCGAQGPGELWQTDDAGVSWRQIPVTLTS